LRLVVIRWLLRDCGLSKRQPEYTQRQADSKRKGSHIASPSQSFRSARLEPIRLPCAPLQARRCIASNETKTDLAEVGKAKTSTVAGTCTGAGSLHVAKSLSISSS
jgi:hypothetical protein